MPGIDGAAVFRRVSATTNRAMLPLLGSVFGRRLLGGSMCVLTYEGRRSGRTMTLPVNYRRDGSDDRLVVHVMAPDAKTWWRNFTGEGAPVQVRVGDVDRAGHGRAARDEKGRVRVRIALV